MYADIVGTLSNKWLREKLTIEERVKLLIEITEDLEWGKFDSFSEEDKIEARKDLQRCDDEFIKHGW